MILKNLFYISLCFTFYSCFSLSLDNLVDVNEYEDWLMIGGNPEKTNTSKSPSQLNPPFNLFWQYDVDGGLARNCLSASDAILFVNTLNEEHYSIDITSGKSLGRISTDGASFSTPLIISNNVIIASSGDKNSVLFCYSLIKGERIWERNVKWVESSPVMTDNFIFVSNIAGELYKLNALTGSIVWKSRTGKQFNSFYTSPTAAGGKIFLGSNDSFIYAFESVHGKPVWKYKTGASVFCDVSENNGKIFFGSDDKNYYCLDTAGNLKWKKFMNTKFLSSAAFFKDRVIITGIDGNVYSLDTAEGEVKWKFTTKGVISASPLLHGDKIFIGSYDKNFYCLNAYDGKELWRFKCEGKIHTSAIVWKDFIFTASDDKYVYCFK